MKRLLIIMSLLRFVVIGCAGANITSTIRESKLGGGGDVQTRCEPCDMRSASELKKIFEKYPKAPLDIGTNVDDS
jgi:hypothetical protein